MYFQTEPDEVFQALVKELALSSVPTTIMGVTFVTVGLYSYLITNLPVVVGITILGSLLTLAKLVLMALQTRRVGSTILTRKIATRWERAQASLTLGFAASVGGLSSITFWSREPTLQMLGTAILFGYCSGMVARLSIRPKIAIAAVGIATAPVIIMTASYGDLAHGIIAVIFAAFAIGSVETVRHAHRRSVHHISTMIDMATLARNDPLTGLLNRLGLREAFQKIRSSKALPPTIAVYSFDLNGFKPINDHYGHAVGDEVLIDLASRIQSIMRGNMVASRIGGDEFVLLQGGADRAEEAQAVAQSVLSCITEPYSTSAGIVSLGVSIGFTLSTPSSLDLDLLLRQADLAVYQAKRQGGGIACFDSSSSPPSDTVTASADRPLIFS